VASTGADVRARRARREFLQFSDFLEGRRGRDALAHCLQYLGANPPSEAYVLPFTKRSARPEEASDLINTGDIEVVRPAAARRISSFPAPPAERPRVFARSMGDDEMTMLMPRKGQLAALDARAQAFVQSAAPVRPSNRPRAVLEDPPTRQFVKPGAPPPSVSPIAMSPSHNARALARATSSAPKASRSAPPPAISAAPKSDSDVKSDPPATVITTRTRIIPARPTVSWAAALVAMGVFVGLVTAVVARGDADSLIDATASFVDPSGNHMAAAGAVGSTSNLQTKFVTPNPVAPSTPDTTLVTKGEGEMKAVALADLPSASPLPQRAAPVAYAAPRAAAPRTVWVATRPAPKPAAAPAPVQHEERVAKAEPAPKKEAPVARSARAAAPAPAGKASDDDMESASAADALAKAQLEASLR
jgi:hypothetical protein